MKYWPGILVALCSIALGAEISTVAGNGKPGYTGDGGLAAAATLNQPFGVIVGPAGNIFFCDTNNQVIRKIDRRSGIITTVIGNGKKGYSGDGGKAVEATLHEPYEVRFHPDGDMYWVERLNHIVRKMDFASGIVSTVAGTGKPGFSGDGGQAVEAMMNEPHSIQFDAAGSHLYICDIKNHRIRVLDIATEKIDTFCGNGKPGETDDGARIGKDTPLKGPRALDISPDGDLWLATREGNQVFRLDMKAKRIHHIAGTGAKGFSGNGGPAKEATLSGPKGLAISPDARWIYLADTESHTVRAIDTSQNPPTLELIAGDGKKGDGPDSPHPLQCRMARLHGLGVDPKNGDLYIGDSETHKLRVIHFNQ